MTSTTPTGHTAGKESVMDATHTTTVTHVDGDAHRIDCTCGERVTYAGKAFTEVEAMRHQRWHQAAGR